jgi:hypothetical protein
MLHFGPGQVPSNARQTALVLVGPGDCSAKELTFAIWMKIGIDAQNAAIRSLEGHRGWL